MLERDRCLELTLRAGESEEASHEEEQRPDRLPPRVEWDDDADAEWDQRVGKKYGQLRSDSAVVVSVRPTAQDEFGGELGEPRGAAEACAV